jgi:hypothetical protein
MKYSLDEEVDYDFKLIGISCHEKDYRLCWGINSVTELNLERQPRDVQPIPTKKKPEVSSHPLFSGFEYDDENEYHLIVNRTPEGYLIPEKPQADYLLLIRDNFPIDLEQLCRDIKSIPFVLTVFMLEPETLKSRDNLIF